MSVTLPNKQANGTVSHEIPSAQRLIAPGAEMQNDKRYQTNPTPKPVVIELLGEPKGKARARRGKNGVHYTPAATRSHENALGIMAAQAMRGRTPLQGALRVVVLAYMSVPRSWSGRRQQRALDGIERPTVRPDSDNIVKMLDALNRIVWRDDSQIVELQMSKHYSGRPRTRIEVIPL
jgi:Holliday junction resolvase RusA-like endonuclease